MVSLPSKQKLAELKSFNEPFCLSIYAPFIAPNATTNPNKIELKNLLREAEIALESVKLPHRFIKAALAPAKELLKNQEFWPVYQAGLALFMHPKFFRYYHLPDGQLPYQITLEQGFNLDPLLEIIRRDRVYYILALSHKNVKFYPGGYYNLKQLIIKGLPVNLKEALRIDEYPNWTETHSVGPASRQAHSEALHGQYNESEVDKKELLEFFRLINKRLHQFLHTKSQPLVLAGVGYLIPIYKQANTYPYLADQYIKGNPEHIKMDELRVRASKIVKKFTPAAHKIHKKHVGIK